MAALVEHDGRYGASTLYRLYHIGVGEVHKRLAGQSAGARRRPGPFAAVDRGDPRVRWMRR